MNLFLHTYSYDYNVFELYPNLKLELLNSLEWLWTLKLRQINNALIAFGPTCPTIKPTYQFERTLAMFEVNQLTDLSATTLGSLAAIHLTDIALVYRRYLIPKCFAKWPVFEYRSQHVSLEEHYCILFCNSTSPTRAWIPLESLFLNHVEFSNILVSHTLPQPTIWIRVH